MAVAVRPEPVEPKVSEANGALRRDAWFDKLTTNGIASPLTDALDIAEGLQRRRGDNIAPLLDEMPRFLDQQRFGTVLDQTVHHLHHRRTEHRVGTADCHEAAPRPFAAPEGRRLLADRDPVHLRRYGHQRRELSRAGLIAVIRIRCVVSRRLRFGHLRRTTRNNLAGVKHRNGQRIFLPRVKAVTRAGAEAQCGVHDDQPRQPRLESGVDRQSQPDQPAPVLHHQGDIFQIQPLDQRQDVIAVKIECIGIEIGRLVGPAKAEEVRTHHPRAGGGEMRDHLAIEKRPTGFAVEAKERLLRIMRPGIDPGGAQPFLARQIIGIIYRKIEVRDIGETFVGRAEGGDSFSGGHGEYPSWLSLGIAEGGNGRKGAAPPKFVKVGANERLFCVMLDRKLQMPDIMFLENRTALQIARKIFYRFTQSDPFIFCDLCPKPAEYGEITTANTASSVTFETARREARATNGREAQKTHRDAEHSADGRL